MLQTQEEVLDIFSQHYLYGLRLQKTWEGGFVHKKDKYAYVDRDPNISPHSATMRFNKLHKNYPHPPFPGIWKKKMIKRPRNLRRKEVFEPPSTLRGNPERFAFRLFFGSFLRAFTKLQIILSSFVIFCLKLKFVHLVSFIQLPLCHHDDESSWKKTKSAGPGRIRRGEISYLWCDPPKFRKLNNLQRSHAVEHQEDQKDHRTRKDHIRLKR